MNFGTEKSAVRKVASQKKSSPAILCQYWRKKSWRKWFSRNLPSAIIRNEFGEPALTTTWTSISINNWFGWLATPQQFKSYQNATVSSMLLINHPLIIHIAMCNHWFRLCHALRCAVRSAVCMAAIVVVVVVLDIGLNACKRLFNVNYGDNPSIKFCAQIANKAGVVSL